MPGPYQHIPAKLDNVGVDLRSPVDKLGPGRYRMLGNLASTIEGAFTTRPGTTIQTNSAFDQLTVHTIGFLNDPVLSTSLLWAGAGTKLYKVSTATVLITGFSGHPLSALEYRLSGNSSAYSIIADSAQMKKLNSAGTPFQLGITPPVAAVVTTAQSPSLNTVETFDADAGFTYTNTASHTVANFTVGAGGAGRSSNVVTITTSTAHNFIPNLKVHVAGLTDTSFNGDFVVASVPSATTFTYAQTGANATTGNGTVSAGVTVVTNSGVTASFTKVAALDLSTVGGLAASDSDYFNLFLNLDNPANITQVQVLFDIDINSVSAGVFTGTAFTRNYYIVSLGPSDFQAAAVSTVTGLAARQAAIQRALTRASAFPSGLNLGTLAGANLQNIDLLPTAPGQTQWNIFQILRSKFQKIGTDTSRSWANVQGFKVVIVTAAGVATTCIFDQLYLFGGVGPDSSVGSNYDYRATFANESSSNTLNSESNPSPIQGSTTALVRQAATLALAAASADAQVTHARFWRRGGTLTDNWRLLGQQANATTFAITAASFASGTATITSNGHGMLAGQGIVVAGVNPSGYNGTFIISSVTTNTISYALGTNPGAYVSGGTVQFADTSTDTAINSALTLSLTNDVPITTVDSTGATVLAQPLQFIWGVYNGNTIFGCGDPKRPGYLYWCNAANPDGWGSTNNVEVTQPSDPLQNGFIWGGQPWVFSKEKLYSVQVLPIGSASTYVGLDALAGHGLFARWGLAASPATPKVWFVGKDAVYEWLPGSPAISITEDDLYPLFHSQTVDGNSPIDFSQEDRIRLTYFDQNLRFTYQDTLGVINTWLYHISKRRWTGPWTYPFGPDVFYPQPETTNVVLLGGNNGNVYQESGTVATDNLVAITCHFRSGFYDLPDPQLDKEYGGLVLDFNSASVVITPTMYFNDGTLTSVVMQNLANSVRSQVELSLTDLYGRSAGVDLTWSGSAAPTIYGFEILYRPDEMPVTHYESPASSFGMAGYGHVYDGYIGLRSTDTVTLSLVVDGVALAPQTLASTAGKRLRTYVQFPASDPTSLLPAKGKTFQLTLDSNAVGLAAKTAPARFKLYPEDSYLNLMPWGASGAAEVRPFKA